MIQAPAQWPSWPPSSGAVSALRSGRSVAVEAPSGSGRFGVYCKPICKDLVFSREK